MTSRIGPRIIERRNKLGLTRAELARAISVSANSVRNWEMGSCRPRSSLLPALARHLSVDEQYLRSGEAISVQIDGPALGSLVDELTQRFAAVLGVPPEQIVISVQISPAHG